jgi:F0F1-type ATP synthase membrane subunit b/b'
VKQARKELTEYAGDLATSRAQALLEQSMTEADRKHFFAESVKRVEESQS